MNDSPLTLSRRRFLRQTFGFSALALTGGLRRLARAAELPNDPGGLHFLMLGDWGRADIQVQQHEVAQGMQAYAKAAGLRPEALLLLGDNFYGQFDGGVNCPRWRTQFEEMYPKSVFDCPCHAIIGNHDYHDEPAGKLQAQLDYAAAHPGTRWSMPAKWYRFEYPRRNPLVTFLALDSNFPHANFKFPTLTAAERDAQNAWLRSEIAKPHAPYLVVLGHHPVYSNGVHGDNAQLIRDWEPLLREHRAHLYLAGHDHDLQHLEFADHPTSFVISGGGGAKLTKIVRDPKARGPYGLSVAGFSHLHITPERLTLRHIDATGKLLHAFSKTLAGQVTT